jgi:acylphosphatase
VSDVSRGAFSAVVQGRVQGVGFRWATRRVARDLGLVGRVRNLADGTVEVVAEGSQGELEALGTWLRTGPTGARVDRLTLVAREPEGIRTSFEID